MSFDTSRYRFDPWKNYSGVVMEQGRVQLDSDWNEWLAQLNRRIQAGSLDTLGRAAFPATTPFAFKVSFDAGKLVIGPGRMYVDGLLVENHGDPATAVWDAALEEMSNSPQPPQSTETGAIGFLDQPYYSPLGPNPALPTSGTFLAYLDVWTRDVDYLQDPDLVESAVAVDTTGRLQTVWQVVLVSVDEGTLCGNAGSPWPAPSGGLLTTAPVTSTPSGPCCLTNNTGYTGPENQHYRIEIHTPGAIGVATFKWSRDNASVETAVTGILAVTNSVKAPASQLTLLSMGRDQVLGFRPGDWIEILDDELELAGKPGELHRIDTIDFAGRTITLDSPVSASFPGKHTRIRRWDQPDNTGEIPITTAGAAVMIEYGITAAFDVAPGGVFNSGDYWTFAARTDGSIDLLTKAATRGIHHHYSPLSVVDFSAGTATDCRVPWNPGCKDSCGCCTVTVGDGIESVGQYTSINAALQALPTQGGEVCILPGRYYEYVLVEQKRDVVIRGCGYHTRLTSPTLLPAPPGPPIQAPREQIANPSVSSPNPTGGNADGTFNAIVSISGSEHIQLRSFAVEAVKNEVGVLIDGTGGLIVQPDPTAPNGPNDPANLRTNRAEVLSLPAVIDITVQDLFFTGSTLPAILAQRVRLLHIDDNRILMQDVASFWPSVLVSGIEMHIDRNYVGIQSANNIREWLPATVGSDLDSSTIQAQSAQPADETKTETTTTTSKKTAAKTAKEAKPATEKVAAQAVPQLKQLLDISAYLKPTITVAKHPGGIMIAGPSRSVFVCENQVEGGRFNGITLGNYSIVDGNGLETGRIIGIRTVEQDPCSTTGTFVPPDSSTTGIPGTSIVAGGMLIDIVIDRNRISSMGLCGIGPVGFFDMLRIFEIISIQNLTITNNLIRDTLLLATEAINVFGTAASESSFQKSSTLDGPAPVATAAQDTNDTTSVPPVGSINAGSSNPYGAICIPDVENLVIRDNAITNFGSRPGLKANGIFILKGEMVDISRNQVLETRDWEANATEGATPTNALHGGIVLILVTPPVIPGASYSTSGAVYTNQATAAYLTKPAYEPGMPALRIEENVVRVALGQALIAVGFGPFAISNNHFSCGGMVRGSNAVALAQTVLIANLGASIESAAATKLTDYYGMTTDTPIVSPYSFSRDGIASRALATSYNGTVTFSNNICQLEARVDRQRSITSLTIFSLDHVTFTGNHCWIDALVPAAGTPAGLEALFDALIAAGSVNVTGNRFQESAFSVALSGATIGIANITSQNIATYCLLIAALPSLKINAPNITLVSSLATATNPDPCLPFRGQ